MDLTTIFHTDRPERRKYEKISIIIYIRLIGNKKADEKNSSLSNKHDNVLLYIYQYV